MPLPCPHFFATWLIWHFCYLVGFPLHSGPREPGGLISFSLGASAPGLCCPGLSFPSGLLEREREGGEIMGMGGREATRDQSPRGRALASPVLSFWSLSFHDPFSRRVCDLGLVLSSSLASFTQHRHTHCHRLTPIHTHSYRGAPMRSRDTWPGCLGILTHTLETAQEHSGATRYSQSSNMAPETSTSPHAHM